MTGPTHYHQRIQRATERLAQLQARELLESQRQAARAREAQRREEAKRRVRLAELAFLAGAAALEDAELVGALLNHMEKRSDHQIRDKAHSLGASRVRSTGLRESQTKH